MMTLIIRLCALCAVSSFVEMMFSGNGTKERMRLILGLLMLKLAANEVGSLTQALMNQTELSGFFECLMR